MVSQEPAKLSYLLWVVWVRIPVSPPKVPRMGRKGLNERLKRPLLSPNYGGLTRPAVSLVLKTSGARDGMGIDTSALRHIYLIYG